MYPILPFYAFASLVTLLGVRLQTSYDRTLVWLGAWGAMAAVLVAIAMREIRGDTAGYYRTFLAISNQTFTQSVIEANNNWLFAALLWVLTRFGTSPLWLLLAIPLLCVFMTWSALRQLLDRTDTAIAVMLYSAYPFYINYISSGLKQALAMALLMLGYVTLYHGKPVRASYWFIAATLLHTSTALTLPFIFIHYLTWRPAFGYRRAIYISSTLFIICVALSASGINASAMSWVQDFSSFDPRYDGYFRSPDQFDYRAGFRIDFTLFSFLPLIFIWWLNRGGQKLTMNVSGWWLNLYLLLNCVFHLFSFAPYADRFGTYSWYLIPALTLIALNDGDRRDERRMFVLAFALANVFILQLYTGRNITVAF